MGGQKRSGGFTLWELMMTVTVAGIVLGIAVPSFRVFHRTNVMAAATNDLVTGALFARSEAVKRQLPVTLCLSPAPAAEFPACGATLAGGFIVFVDEDGNGDASDATDGNGAVDSGETVLLRRPAPGGSIRVWSDGIHMTYGRNSFPISGGGQATRFLLCDDRGNRQTATGSAARVIVVDPTGRATARQETDMIAASIALLDADCS